MEREMKLDKFIAIRAFLEMSQPDFADFLGTSDSNIGMIESGKRRITKRMMGRIAKNFEETPEFVAFYERTKRLTD
jgi:plasmid maintenance system antidote protein VapI